jgi:hypothetical protein
MSKSKSQKQNDDDDKNVSLLSKLSVAGKVHDMTLRADDAGPLEVVVNQMGQQITTMNADIQALKNSD